MFELGREGAVAGYGRPAILEYLHGRLADVDHRLDREEHSGLQFRPGARAAGVNHFRRVVEQPAEAVAAEIADDSVAVALGIGLDGMADVAEMVSRPRLL